MTLELRFFSNTWKNLLLLLSGILIGILGFAFLLAGDIYDFSDSANSAHLPPVDAIVCLGGGRGRISAAGDIWYQYWLEKKALSQTPPASPPPILYFAGMGKQATWSLISRQVRRSVLQVIRPQDVVIETESSNTDANAQWLGRYAKEQNWKRILLVTSTYHMKRARFLFEKILRSQGYPVEIQTFSVSQEPFNPRDWRKDLVGIRVTVLEYLKWIYYRSF